MTFRSVALAAGLAALFGAADAGALIAQASAADSVVQPRMTELTRAALSQPGDSAVWSEMASLLPEMARAGSADVMGAFEAARVADSLARAPFDPVAVALESGRRTAQRARGETPTSQSASTSAPSAAGTGEASWVATAMGILPWTLPWLVVAGILVFGPVIRRRRLLARTRGSRPAAIRTEAASGHDRLWTVTTLARSGLPPSEIARRTGMAQDAVRVLMGMSDIQPTVPLAARPTSASPHRPPTVSEQAAGITAERAALMRQARRMKDGRITYGPRVSR